MQERHRVSRIRRIGMGIRVVLAEGEKIEHALHRFRKLLEQHGRLKWQGGGPLWFIKPTQVRRAKEFQKRFKARRATLLAQQGGEQAVGSFLNAKKIFWKRTGKP